MHNGSIIRTKKWEANTTCGLAEAWACLRVIKSGFLSKFEGSLEADPPFSFFGGTEVFALEKEWASFYHAKFGISFNSATSGIYAALGAFQVGVGDEIIVPASTMSAVAVAPLFWNAVPVFADLDEKYGTICPKDIKKKITEKTKAIIVVHQFGTPADMGAIIEIAKEHNLRIIEDCAQAHLSTYKGKPVGSIGDIGVFSLNVNKTIQVGEGSVCITSDESLQLRLALIRNHGENAIDGIEIERGINHLGHNLRMTEVHAAMSRCQLNKVKKLTESRMTLVNYLKDKLSSFPELTPYEGRPDCNNTYYQFPVFVKAEIDVEDLIKKINTQGGYFIRLTKPLYHLTVFNEKNFFKANLPWSHELTTDSDYSQSNCPNAEALYNNLIICEYIRPPSTQCDMDDIVAIFKKVLT